MKPTSSNPIQTTRCQTLSEWHALAARHGAPASFYDGPGSHEQPVQVTMAMRDGTAVALAPVFTASMECGLWVAPEQRKRGLGTAVLRRALSSPQAYLATISQGTPDAAYMARILHRCGFAPYAASAEVTVYRRPPQPR